MRRVAEEPTSFSVLLASYGTTSLRDGIRVGSVALLKVRTENDSPPWSGAAAEPRLRRRGWSEYSTADHVVAATW